ncbi:MAG: type II toxin-antitoxin system VapC family toxin [Gemmatimonadetes bacterium]|nr:type II toxin-antitoxin system VapC family toxin [Gemmatimonadota bacterium]
MIVADANLIVYLHVPGQKTAAAVRVFGVDPIWCAPLLWRSEVRNVLWQLMRGDSLGLRDALAIMVHAEALMAGQEYRLASGAVLELATSSGCSAYECEYVALARELGVRLVTSDRRVLSSFPDIGVSPEGFGR